MGVLPGQCVKGFLGLPECNAHLTPLFGAGAPDSVWSVVDAVHRFRFAWVEELIISKMYATYCRTTRYQQALLPNAEKRELRNPHSPSVPATDQISQFGHSQSCIGPTSRSFHTNLEWGRCCYQIRCVAEGGRDAFCLEWVGWNLGVGTRWS